MIVKSIFQRGLGKNLVYVELLDLQDYVTKVILDVIQAEVYFILFCLNVIKEQHFLEIIQES